MVAILTPKLRQHIRNYSNLLHDIEVSKGEKRKKLMYDRRYLDSRVKFKIEKSGKIINQLINDLDLLEKWDSEKDYHDLISKAKASVSKRMHQKKTSFKSRKLKFEKRYEYTKPFVCPKCGYSGLMKFLADGKGKIISGVPDVVGIDDSRVLLRKIRPNKTWVDEQIAEKNFNRLTELCDYITFRLEEEKKDTGFTRPPYLP